MTLRGVKYPIFLWINDSDHCNWIYDLQWKQTYLDGVSATDDGDLALVSYLNPGDNYEMGAIQGTLDHHHWEEFVLLQDSVEILDLSLFDRLFIDHHGRSVKYNPHFQMYLGKYRRETLEKMNIPVVTNKVEAVRQEEIFHKQYQEIEPGIATFNPGFVDENFKEYPDMYGRKNLLLQDQYIRKYKGTWDSSQL